MIEGLGCGSDEDYGDEEYGPQTAEEELAAAISNHDIGRVEAAIHTGANMNAYVGKAEVNGLHIACHRGYLTMVEHLIHLGADVSVGQRSSQDTPLHIACDRGHLDIAGLLVAAGVQVNAVNLLKSTPLRLAAMKGHHHIMQYLIDNGGDVNQADRTGRTPLITACEQGHLEIVQLLLQAGCHKDVGDSLGRGPVFHAVRRRHQCILGELISHGADLDMLDRRGMAPLHMMCRIGFYDMVKQLLDGGCHKDLQGRLGGDGPTYTPLWEAIQNGHLPAVKLLLAAGADPDIADHNSQMPAHYSPSGLGSSLFALMMSNHCRTDILQSLLQAGVSVNYCNVYGYSALHFAIDKGWLPVAEMLVEADLNLQQELTWIKTSVTRTDITPEIKHFLVWFLLHAQQPRSLRSWCRMSVHRTLQDRRPLNAAIHTLPIPTKLKNILTFTISAS